MSRFRDTPSQIVHDFFPSPVKHGRIAAIKAIRDLVSRRDRRLKELSEALAKCRELAGDIQTNAAKIEEIATIVLIGGDPGN